MRKTQVQFLVREYHKLLFEINIDFNKTTKLLVKVTFNFSFELVSARVRHRLSALWKSWLRRRSTIPLYLHHVYSILRYNVMDSARFDQKLVFLSRRRRRAAKVLNVNFSVDNWKNASLLPDRATMNSIITMVYARHIIIIIPRLVCAYLVHRRVCAWRLHVSSVYI